MTVSSILRLEVLWAKESAKSDLFVPEIKGSFIQSHLHKCSKRPEQSISKYPKFHFSEKIWECLQINKRQNYICGLKVMPNFLALQITLEIGTHSELCWIKLKSMQN